MDYKVFYRKYRPKNFSELVGQDNIKEILSNSIKLNKIAHAYIFTGPRGTGKTSTAKIFAKTLNCIDNASGFSCDDCTMCKTYEESPDIIEIDAASNNGVEEIRTLRDSVKIAPYSSKYKVYIIDEVHMLSNSAWNALLKTLEEPPKHVIFILATTEVNKIPETVMSRCQRFDFSKINFELMNLHLKTICSKENIEINEDALNEIVKLSNGCLRDALSYLDQVSKYNNIIDINLIESNFGILSKLKLNSLYDYILNNDKSNINIVLDQICNSGITPMNFINDFVEYLLNKIIINDFNDNEELKHLKDLIYSLNNLIINFNSVVNPFTLIKVELITLNYFPGNKNVNISQDIKPKNTENVKKEISNKIEINTLDRDNSNLITMSSYKINEIKKIRVNNAFVNPSKDLKRNFINLWSKFFNILNVENEFNILGYIENSSVEVVSKTTIIFSFKSDNESILFNQNLDKIELKFNEINNTNYKFIGLLYDEWVDYKREFIKNEKKYEYMDEKNVNKDLIKTKNIAEDIFGNEIIEIR